MISGEGRNEMMHEALAHAETFQSLAAKDGLHDRVWGEPLHVVGVLQLVLLQIGPQTLHNLVVDRKNTNNTDRSASLSQGQIKIPKNPKLARPFLTY